MTSQSQPLHRDRFKHHHELSRVIQEVSSALTNGNLASKRCCSAHTMGFGINYQSTGKEHATVLQRLNVRSGMMYAS